MPFVAPIGDMRIIRVTDDDVCSVLHLTETGTIEAMGTLEKEFGRNVTTRNWNTVEKLASLEKRA